MSKAKNPRRYLGVRAPTPPNLVSENRAPGASDKGYVQGDFWYDKSGAAVYQFVGLSSGSAVWLQFATNTAGSGSNGQLLIGATSASPEWAALTSADGTIAFTAGANTLDLSAAGSSSTALRFTDVTLTSAEVKALATTPITLVAAPAAGATLMFHGALLKLNYGGSNVFAESGDNLGIKYTDASGVQVSSTIESTGFIDQSADTYTTGTAANDAIVAATGAEAQALVLDNLNANITGNAANDNTLTVRTYYTLQSL